ncbi:Aste57867_2610 [Aphanomyces stellatus]|uniref:Aste57867_2610 protein n=1 Tax=Aphanomyces stellatus TaxID=120398 RepID=A0A485KBP3_9STRA|nr:hypothetical protein As57867_002603 [Aphanomyces stellatus]VFT79806.1 Aste57867_2610 [Aphanomyces stellatus]
MRIQPRDAARGPLPVAVAASSTRGLSIVIGLIYVMASVACSVWYLLILEPSFANDLWWSDYAAMTDQALVVDIFNNMLTTRSTGEVILLGPRASIVDKSYEVDDTSTTTTTDVYPSYVRRLVLNELTTLDYAVVGLRATSARVSMYLPTQYCWVDLNRTFEMAHTAARQARCATRRTNGALYLETVLRNQVWTAYIQTFGSGFAVAFGTWLSQVPHGQRWLESTPTAYGATTVTQEVAYWRTYNISSFELQWQNMQQIGVSETLRVENALGVSQSILLKSVPRTNHLWTSVAMYWLLANDMAAMAQQNCSLIRSATNSFVQLPWAFEEFFGLADRDGIYHNQSSVFRAVVGPFLSVDLFYVVPPTALVTLYEAFQALLLDALATQSSVAAALTRLPAPFAFTPTPPSFWFDDDDMVFYGGNPLCLAGQPLPFVQDTFSFADACDAPRPLTISGDKVGLVFAGFVVGEARPAAICSVEAANERHACESIVRSVLDTTTRGDLAAIGMAIAPFLQPAIDATAPLSVSLMQFASTANATTWSLLTQPILLGNFGDTSPWSFFSALLLYDWVRGAREVVSFEGDMSTLVLLSQAESPVQVISSAASIPNVTRGIYYLVVYTVVVFFVVAIGAVVVLGLNRFDTHGPNLWYFNPIVSTTWVGRPLMFLRGVAAVLVLSTTQLVLVVADPIATRFQFSPRPWLHTMVMAGDASWVLYVLVDFLTVAMHRFTLVYGPVSCCVAWVALVGLEYGWPVQPTATLTRSCSSENMYDTVTCASATLRVGSFARVCTIGAVQVLAVGVGVVLAGFYHRRRRTSPLSSSIEPRHSLGVADVFLAPTGGGGIGHLWCLDKVSCLLSGLVPLSWGTIQYTFDVKLWVLQIDKYSLASTTVKHFSTHCGSIESTPPVHARVGTMHPCARLHHVLSSVGTVVGVGYVVGSIMGSVTYLHLTRVNLANDMYWATFNMSGTHGFLANWLNMQLVLGVNQVPTMRLDTPEINRDGAAATSPLSIVVAPSNHGAWLQQSVLNSVGAAIVGLRATNACAAPWIFTQYCFVDFDQRWEMANSAARQKRCHAMTTNGAVFLDAMLRNIPFDAFSACWGPAFDVAVANDLRQSREGQAWLAQIAQRDNLPVADETVLWQHYAIDRFESQWQNFKRIGITNSYSVVNANGMVFPFTLQKLQPSYRIDQQTTFSMYWGLANDLSALGRNDSAVAGLSLIRSSPRFAFGNVSVETVLQRNGTLPSPWTAVMAATKRTLGPFGSVDMRVIPCPIEATAAVRAVYLALRRTLATDPSAQVAYSQIPATSSTLSPVPKAWTDAPFWSVAGSPLCPGGFASSIFGGMTTLVSWDKQCSATAPMTYLGPSVASMIASVVLANVSAASMAATCQQNPMHVTECNHFLNETVAFVATYLASDLGTLAPLVGPANAAVRKLNIQLVQFGQPSLSMPTVVLFQSHVLDPTEAAFTYFAWNFLVDWTLGSREVVAFQGDSATLALVTDFLTTDAMPVNASEHPGALAIYLQSIVAYITVAMIAVAGLALFYIVLSRGHIEVLNLLELQRVGAIVWIGRPLLLVRSLTALSLLSTSSLELVFDGHVTSFHEVHDPVYKTLLAANEITWLVAIVNDIAMAATREYTIYYATLNSALVWLATAALSLAAPMTHALTIDRQCQLTQLDWHVHCTSATLSIGHASRVITITAVVLGCNATCYGLTRLLGASPVTNQVDSRFLYAGARYLFVTAKWIHHDVYYMDRMSAFLNGILTLRWRRSMHGLDVKLWRTFSIELPREYDVPYGHELYDAAPHTLPLPLEST